MEKVFLYLYPVKEFFRYYLNDEEALKILNEAIKQRYKEKGYKVICAMFPNNEVCGIDKELIDDVVYVEIAFPQFTTNNIDEEFNYPNEKALIKKLSDVKELVVGGFHCNDFVKKLSEIALEQGINCFIDLDLTDLFFYLYKTDYFRIDSYDPNRFNDYMLQVTRKFGSDEKKL